MDVLFSLLLICRSQLGLSLLPIQGGRGWCVTSHFQGGSRVSQGGRSWYVTSHFQRGSRVSQRVDCTPQIVGKQL